MLADTIQIALAPVFLLVATASVMGVIAGRLARVVDRSRALMERMPDDSEEAHRRTVVELHGLNKRMGIINWSIGLCVATGLVVCVMVAMLFIQGGGDGPLETPIAVSFIIAMALLLAALTFFLAEVRFAITAIKVPSEMLEMDSPPAAAVVDAAVTDTGDTPGERPAVA